MSNVTVVTRSAWATPVLIVCLVIGAYGVGWWSGKNGSFVRNLIQVAQTATWLKDKLDFTTTILDRERSKALKATKEKLALEKRLRALTAKRKAPSKPAPKAAPKPDPKPYDDPRRRRHWHR